MRDRGVGKFLSSTADRWSVKKTTYSNEGVWGSFTVLRDSFRVLLRDADGVQYNVQAHNAAQIMMDAFLIRRSRCETVKVPREVVPVNAAPGESDGILELFEIDEELDGKTISENDKIKWVADNFQRAGVTRSTAPSDGAYSMLLHYRKTEQRQEDFYKTILPKLLTKESSEGGDKLMDDGKETVALIDTLLLALGEEK